MISTGFVFHNAITVDASGITNDAWIVTDRDRILATGHGSDWQPYVADRTLVNAERGYVTPGLIDLHMHGGGGTSNEDGCYAILNALNAHHRHGTTRAVISFVAANPHTLRKNLHLVGELAGENPLILGSHLEGPFLSPARRGAHNAAYLRDPDPATVRSLIEASQGTLKQVTLDPLRPGSADAIKAFTAAGTRVAIGHTEAGYEAASTAFSLGATILTHAFNAMPGLGHRDPGPVMAALDNPTVTLELILDSHHVHSRMSGLLFQLAPARVALITDAMAGAAAPDGTYELGDLPATVSGGVAHLEGTQTLAGSTLTLDRAIRGAIAVGIDLVDVITAATLTPARTLGLHETLGKLAPGYFADLVLFTPQWTVKQAYGAGRALT